MHPCVYLRSGSPKFKHGRILAKGKHSSKWESNFSYLLNNNKKKKNMEIISLETIKNVDRWIVDTKDISYRVGFFLIKLFIKSQDHLGVLVLPPKMGLFWGNFYLGSSKLKMFFYTSCAHDSSCARKLWSRRKFQIHQTWWQNHFIYKGLKFRDFLQK